MKLKVSKLKEQRIKNNNPPLVKEAKSALKCAFVTNVIEGSDVLLWHPFFAFLKPIVANILWDLVLLFIYSFKPYKIIAEYELPNGAYGYTILVMMSGRLMYKYPKVGLQRTLMAARFAEKKLQVDVIGLGSLTKFVTKNGKLLKEGGIEAYINHGDAFTVASILKGLGEILKQKAWESPTIGIVGAYGTIGTPLVEILRKKYKLVLIGRREERLNQLKDKMGDLNCIYSTDIRSLKQQGTQIIITCASDPSSIISDACVPQGAIIYEVSQPNNTPKNLLKRRSDLELVDGGFIQLPYHIDIGFWMRLQAGVSYACFCEMLMQAIMADSADHNEDYIPQEHIAETLEWAEKTGFELAPFSCFGRPITLKGEKEKKENYGELIKKSAIVLL